MKKLLFSAAALCALSSIAAPQAQAQSLNYGVMQEMFGEPVTTSANGSPMRASDAPLDMTIISAEDIARYPARNIPDILRHYAGVSVRQNTATEYSVGIRGYNSAMNERILVLVNGRQVFEDYFGLVNWSAIPVELNEIRQIEIVRGPNTALFGFNATSGVVNIVTVNPLYDDIDVVEADAGINSYKRGSAVYTWQNDDKFGLRVSAASSKIGEDDNTVNSAATSLRDEAYVSRFNMDLGLQLNDKTQMRFEASSGTVDENQKDVFDAVYRRDAVNQSGRVNLNSDTDWGIIDATMYRNSFNSLYKGTAGNFEFDNDVTVLQLSDTFKIGTSHTVRLAGEYRTNTVDMLVNGTNFGEETLNISSASALWYWNINSKLSTSAAVRYDHVNADFDASAVGYFASPFSPEQYQNRYDEIGYNLGVVYKPTDLDTFRLTFAKGVDLPSTFELSTLIPGAASLYGDPTTEVSTIFDYQLGYERQLSSINGKFKLGAFYQYIEEMQSTRAITATTSYYDNVGDSEVYGFEAGLEGMTNGGIRWGMNYSYSDIEDDFISTTSTNFERQHSEHMVKLNLGYSPTEEWSFDAFAAYESDFKQVVDTSTTTTTDLDTFRLTFAKGVDLPSTFELSTLIPGAASLYGDPTTEVSTIFDYQLGYERQLSSINGKFKLGAFYQYIEEMQSTRAITATTSYYDNVGDSEVYGFEAGLEGMTNGGIRWGMNYSYSDIEDDFISTTSTNFERQHSEHMVKLNLGYSPTEEWSFDAFAAYESDFKQVVDTSTTTTSLRNIDPDVIVDAKIAYSPAKFEGLTLSLNGQAIFGENEQSAVGEEVDSQVFLRAKYEF